MPRIQTFPLRALHVTLITLSAHAGIPTPHFIHRALLHLAGAAGPLLRGRLRPYRLTKESFSQVDDLDVFHAFAELVGVQCLTKRTFTLALLDNVTLAGFWFPDIFPGRTFGGFFAFWNFVHELSSWFCLE